jgi:bifunctional non-homologous end joining protein LigD
MPPRITARPDPALARYRQKRNFAVTPEPAPEVVAAVPAAQPLAFVIQKHWASRLHYDFRLEWNGVLLSWAVPKGPSFDPAEKRMAVHVEDHPVSYGGFEGTIPKGHYGAGTVIVWDAGTWTPVGDPQEGLAQGKLLFDLHGQKLAGRWELVRIAKPGDRQDPWMLFKKRDAWARPLAEYDVIAALPDSVVDKPLGLLETREPRAAAPRGAAARGAPDLSAAVDAPLPPKLEPQLATAVAKAPAAGDWLVEAKLDGYRLMARADGRDVRLFTRNGHDWTDRLRPLAAAVAKLPLLSAWIDGEIVVLGADGVPDFNALQNAIDGGRNGEIVWFAFDLPFLDGRDLRRVPLWSRRALLAEIVGARADERIRFSAAFDAPPDQVLQAARAMKLEGIMLKRADAPYVSGRTETWLKLKWQLRQEFVVVGFTDRANAPGEVGSLLLGVFEGEALRYVGNVGTGWDGAAGRDLHRRLAQIETPAPAATLEAADVAPGRWSRRTAGGERWVEPKLVVEVAYGDWTPEGRIRHAVYQGLRGDKPAREVMRDTLPLPASTGTGTGAGRPASAGVKVTHGERVVDASTGLRKIDLVRYYESVAERILPHLAQRPVSLVRAPDGLGGALFFQKHPETRLPGLTELDPALWPGHGPLLAIDGADALIAAAQMNVIEFHGWNSTTRRIDAPDRMIFDLDPGEGVPWRHLQEAALLVRTLLDELGLQAWLKTSGGKGLHVVVPLAPRRDYDTVKGFSQAVVQHVARTIPQRFVARSGAANRVGRVFIDYLRNGFAQTTAVAFSARARPGLGVSMPVAWDDLTGLTGGAQWTVATAREHLSFERADPWAGLWLSRQTLTRAMKTLGWKPAGVDS